MYSTCTACMVPRYTGVAEGVSINHGLAASWFAIGLRSSRTSQSVPVPGSGGEPEERRKIHPFCKIIILRIKHRLLAPEVLQEMLRARHEPSRLRNQIVVHDRLQAPLHHVHFVGSH